MDQSNEKLAKETRGTYRTHYSDATRHSKDEHGNKRSITTTNREIQGDTISPKLFTATLERIFGKLNWEQSKNAGIEIQGNRLTLLRFADDIVLTGKTMKDVQRRLEDLARESTKVDLDVIRKMRAPHYQKLERKMRVTMRIQKKHVSISKVKQALEKPIVTQQSIMI
ncbi:reverse transcriptase (RNA-dependent DNA polymerase) domain-containing protein [Ditylenchus destructor]|uniref:Reverse transcriptase (RNA-dependent DNA polymerase) domain-containing protein n=1 Tax=Ditylenchus destructor TaxID=166010 RepID=A0AAD4MTU8_9BILA|nr:reverse transcriptase (RNA-dependent DNA polymerase) domain-containing protein [Ditylenchus destructor]